MTRKRKAIISKLNFKCWQQVHKYGIIFPRSDDEAKNIDDDIGGTKWTNGILLKMKNFRVASMVHEGNIIKIPGYQ